MLAGQWLVAFLPYLYGMRVDVFERERSMSADAYRRQGAKCVWIAERTTDPQDRASLITMAQSWLLLARHAEKNVSADLGCETPTNTTSITA